MNHDKQSGPFDPLLLATFLAVVQTRSFTAAGKRLSLRQSTVSQHIRRLEAAAARRLLLRDTHSVRLTQDGEAMVEFARTILEANARAGRYFAAAELRGRLRFGASEDFVTTRLPEVLRDFTRQHPQVDLELTVELSSLLFQKLDAGALDLVLGKRLAPGGGEGRGGPEPAGGWGGRGQVVWREPLVWIGREDWAPSPGRPLPLILFPPPSITRTAALDAMALGGGDWRLACTSSSLSGLRAAALAGLGVSVQARSMVPAGLVALPPSALLPPLAEVEFIVTAGRLAPQGPARALAETMLASGNRLQSWNS